MIEDMGVKIGLNGIDNARLMFDNVKVPRTAMLNAFNRLLIALSIVDIIFIVFTIIDYSFARSKCVYCKSG